MLPGFLRGALRQRKPFTTYGDHVWEWALHVESSQGVALRLLDTIPRLTDDLDLLVDAIYTFVVTPFLYDPPRTYVSGQLPPGVGSADGAVWWEQPIWWAGIVRELGWRPPALVDALATRLEPSQSWTLLETPAGDMLWKSDSDLRVGDLIEWPEVRWFKPLAILPA